MNSLLEEIDWDETFKDKNLEDMLKEFYTKIELITKDCVPPKKQSKSKKQPPWMTNKTRRNIRKKHCAWIRYQQSKSYQKYMLFVKQRDKTAKLLRKAKKNFEMQLAKECKSNPKAIFKYANFKSKPRKNVIRLKDADGNIQVKDQDNASILNTFFKSVFTKETDAPDLILHQASSLLWNEEDTDPFDFPNKQLLSHLNHFDITEDMVWEELKQIDPNKSNSPDCIHPRVIKEAGRLLVKPLHRLFSQSLNTGQVPCSWKNGIISALFKDGDRHESSNYRPITLTPILCRTLERIIKKEIMKHIEENNILYKDQHGFVNRRSCLSNLLSTLEDITALYDQGYPVDEIFLDLRKAFDKVPHQRLLYKLKKLGLGGNILNWIESFLSARKQRVRVRRSYSQWTRVESGVPQGSVLGPILFILYINDLPDAIKSSCKIFADDTKLIKPVNNEDDAKALQQDLVSLQQWCDTWKLQFNPQKCHVLHIGKNNIKHAYTINDQPVIAVDEEKDLGCMMDKSLKIETHVTYCIKKANKMLGLIKRTFSYLNKDIFLVLYKTYVRPLLEYCQQAFSPYLAKDTNELEKVQRRATKMVKEICDLSYEDRLEKLGLYSLEYRRERGDLILMYQLVWNLIDVDNKQFFSFVTDPKTRGHSLRIKTPKACKTEIRRNFFSQKIVLQWNNLPSAVVYSPNIDAFKRRYDEYKATAK